MSDIVEAMNEFILALRKLDMKNKLEDLQQICLEVYGVGLVDIAIDEFERLHNIILCLNALEPVYCTCECCDEEEDFFSCDCCTPNKKCENCSEELPF